MPCLVLRQVVRGGLSLLHVSPLEEEKICLEALCKLIEAVGRTSTSVSASNPSSLHHSKRMWEVGKEFNAVGRARSPSLQVPLARIGLSLRDFHQGRDDGQAYMSLLSHLLRDLQSIYQSISSEGFRGEKRASTYAETTALSKALSAMLLEEDRRREDCLDTLPDFVTSVIERERNLAWIHVDRSSGLMTSSETLSPEEVEMIVKGYDTRARRSRAWKVNGKAVQTFTWTESRREEVKARMEPMESSTTISSRFSLRSLRMRLEGSLPGSPAVSSSPEPASASKKTPLASSNNTSAYEREFLCVLNEGD